MEAKDTVVPIASHSMSIGCPHCGGESGIENLIENEREMQAEISFQAGIREVVEWVASEGVHGDGLCHYCPNCDCTIRGATDTQWQAKLKEWRIE